MGRGSFQHSSPHLVRNPFTYDKFENGVFELLFIILQSQEVIMADITALQTAVSDLTVGAAATKTALDDLAAKIGNLTAGDVSQADIDSLTDSVTAATTALASAVATDDPAPVAEPVTPPADGGAAPVVVPGA